MAPAGEDGEDCKEEEEMAPLNMEIVMVETLEEVESEESQHKEIEQDPRDKEATLPFAHPMASKAGIFSYI